LNTVSLAHLAKHQRSDPDSRQNLDRHNTDTEQPDNKFRSLNTNSLCPLEAGEPQLYLDTSSGPPIPQRSGSGPYMAAADCGLVKLFRSCMLKG
jgi:hypothetical protein